MSSNHTKKTPKSLCNQPHSRTFVTRHKQHCEQHRDTQCGAWTHHTRSRAPRSTNWASRVLLSSYFYFSLFFIIFFPVIFKCWFKGSLGGSLRLRVQLLILAQAVTSGSWDQACLGPPIQCRVSLGFSVSCSRSPPNTTLKCTRSLSLKWINKRLNVGSREDTGPPDWRPVSTGPAGSMARTNNALKQLQEHEAAEQKLRGRTEHSLLLGRQRRPPEHLATPVP